jgi:hypothetical protein
MKVLLYAVFKDPRGDFETESIAYVNQRESSPEDVPSKLSSTADSIDRVGLDLYRDVVLFPRLCAQTNRETTRAKNLSPTLAINGRRTPG